MSIGDVIRAAVENYRRLHPQYSPRIGVAQEAGLSYTQVTQYILGNRTPTEEILETIFTVCDYPQGLTQVKQIQQKNAA